MLKDVTKTQLNNTKLIFQNATVVKDTKINAIVHILIHQERNVMKTMKSVQFVQ
jgi:hypothetical protein